MEEMLIADVKEIVEIEKMNAEPLRRKKVTKEELDIIAEKKIEEKKFFKKIAPTELRKMTIEERKKYYVWLGERDSEKITGVFHFYERPGGDLEFEFGEYPGQPIERYHLIDGQTHTISLGAARHLNKSGWYPEYEYIPGGKNIMVPDGQPTNMRIGKKVRRFGFQKLDYMEEDMTEFGQPISGLVSVEYVGNENLTS